MAELDQIVAEQAALIYELKNRMVTLEGYTKKMRKRLDNIDPDSVEQFFDDIRSDSKAFHESYRSIISKMTIIEMMDCVYGDKEEYGTAMRNCIKALDRPNSFWSTLEGYTIEELYSFFLDIDKRKH